MAGNTLSNATRDRVAQAGSILQATKRRRRWSSINKLAILRLGAVVAVVLVGVASYCAALVDAVRS
jgi:hypothetical protein